MYNVNAPWDLCDIEFEAYEDLSKNSNLRSQIAKKRSQFKINGEYSYWSNEIWDEDEN